ncbi:restriction endonuclease subunit S [Pseudoalteromonas rhizosphaerae]|uniref:restriction endonuclease subunit S n=1 Tax=Pseudoalteromonas rhizosphaerae TaxID=2518973 RepID=UPI00384AF4D3
MSELKVGKYQAYPEYRDSKIDWLERVPSHWIEGSVKYICKSLDYKRIPLSAEERGSRQGEYPYYGASGVIDRVDDYLFDEDTILFGEDGANLLAKSTPLAFVASGKYWVNNHAHILKPLDEMYSFWVNSLNNLDISPVVSGSAQPKLTAEALGNLEVVYPQSVEERQKIANFLDHETAKIDILIEKQQQLIKLLKEKRQAVISHAVTKGLNPNAPMKDSGVEWLGEVPEHWDVKYIKHLSQVKRGASPRPIDDPKYFDDDGEYAWVRIADVSSAGMYLTSTTQRLSELGSSLSVKLGPNQLFVSIAGTVGKPCLTISKACIHDGFVYFPSLSMNNKFLYYIFEAGEAYLGLGKMGTQLNLNTDTVGGIKIGVPPSGEIDKIIELIEVSNKKFDCLIERAIKSVSLMQERRTALISAAVTGKIDVRNWEQPND